LPIDENHPTNATNSYGRSKLHIEEMLRDIANSDSEWKIICLRYFNPVGAHESGLIGEDPAGVPNNLLPYIAQVAGRARSHLVIFGSDYLTIDGTGIRDYIHVVDLAEGHAKAFEFIEKSRGWHAINLGAGRGYSVFEVVTAFESATAQKIPYRVVARRMGDVPQCYANPEKAKILLNWSARRILQEMCLSAWNFQKLNYMQKP
jgi:UDP-glucose 4-epimerase